MFSHKKIAIVFLFLLLGLLVFSGNCSAAKPSISNLSYSPANPSVGDSVIISFDLDVGGSRSEGRISFGDDATPFSFDFIQCNSDCSLSYTHAYSTEGSKSVEITVENIASSETDSASLSVNIGATGGGGGTGAGSGTGGSGSGDNPIEARTFGELLDKIVRVVFWIAVIVFPLGIVAGGILFLTSSANPSNIELAKKIILYCAVILGLIIMIKLLLFVFKDDLTFTK